MSGVSTNPGLYPGNPSLPREVRDKILSTFKHTLTLYHEGKVDDCMIGCDFILKMDPRFSPARRLMEKAKNPNADVDVIELEAIVAKAPVRQTASPADAEKLLVRAVESFNARDFDACIAAAEQVLAALPGNVHAAELVAKAKDRKLSQGAFETARGRALAAFEAKRFAEAARELEAMRVLDPDHPAVALFERRLEQASTAGAPAKAPEPPSAAGGAAGHWSAPAVEPAISFQASSGTPGSDGLDALSLDSLSLDEPASHSTVVAPPAGFQADGRGPLEAGAAPPRADRGSPGDLWTNAPEGSEEPAPPPSEARPAAPRPVEDEAASEREIETLLHQGDDASGRGDYEGAIEIWSRIFLIDINSVEAVTRIEKARAAMSEGNRRAVPMIEEGRAAFEAGDLDGARSLFLEVLTIAPNEPTARSYLDRIEEQIGAPASTEEPTTQPARPADDEDAVRAEAAPGTKAIRIRVPPKAVVVAAVFSLLVAIGAWLVLRQPKPAPASRNAPVLAGGSLEKATAFFQEGKIPEAVAELKKVRPSDPDYDKAARMLESLTHSAAPASSAPAAAAPAGSVSADQAGARARAEQSLGEKRYIDALKDFSAVSAAYQGDPTFAQEMSLASSKVTELTPAVKLYNDGEYETAIPVFWRIFQADRGNQDARSYLLRSYANQGITQLQNGLFDKAKQSFDEALAIDPNDTELVRHRKFAERYKKGELDLLGRIYVRHLPHRP